MPYHDSDLSKRKRPSVPWFISKVKTDPLSKRICKLDNAELTQADLNGVYITTNEFGSDKISDKLLINSAEPRSCHIGFSGWHNFDLMALRRSSRGIICDYNPETHCF